MTTTQTPRRACVDLGKRSHTPAGVTPEVAELRDTLGRAHYERMRAGMWPALNLDGWDQLSEATREHYRTRLDYVVPGLLILLDPEVNPWQT